jgi:hypothetical protein
MTTTTLTRPAPVPFFAEGSAPACHPGIAERWHTEIRAGWALHQCRRHCPLAAQQACRVMAQQNPPTITCIQAGQAWQAIPNRGRRVVARPLPPAEEPVEEMCPACVLHAQRRGLCTECLAPVPRGVDGRPRLTCSPRCVDVRQARIKRLADRARTETPAGTVLAVTEGDIE